MRNDRYLIDQINPQESWRIFRIMAEFVDGIETMSSLEPAVTIFGSARSKPGDRYYTMAVETARLLAQEGFSVITGGGPGIMEAANRGASEAAGQSIGLNITLPQEQSPNPFVTSDLSFEFHYFFMRKFWLVYLAKALVIFPGGFGTLDELFEVLTLMQTKRSRKIMPVVVYGTDYWSEVINFDALVDKGAIAPEDLKLIHFSNDPEEAFSYLARTLTQLHLRGSKNSPANGNHRP